MSDNHIKPLHKPGRVYLAKTLYIFSMGAQFVLTSLYLAIGLKVSDLLSSSPPPPTLSGKFKEVIHMIFAWKDHMKKLFIPY